MDRFVCFRQGKKCGSTRRRASRRPLTKLNGHLLRRAKVDDRIVSDSNRTGRQLWRSTPRLFHPVFHFENRSANEQQSEKRYASNNRRFEGKFLCSQRVPHRIGPVLQHFFKVDSNRLNQFYSSSYFSHGSHTLTNFQHMDVIKSVDCVRMLERE